MEDRIQKCIIINKENLDVIEEGLENIKMSTTYGKKSITLHNVLETRKRIKDIRNVIDKVDEVRVCWG